MKFLGRSLQKAICDSHDLNFTIIDLDFSFSSKPNVNSWLRKIKIYYHIIKIYLLYYFEWVSKIGWPSVCFFILLLMLFRLTSCRNLFIHPAPWLGRLYVLCDLLSDLFTHLFIYPPWWFDIKDTLKVFDDFKTKQKGVWSNVFRYEKVRILWNCI